jgi:putative ABC transport system permease protein
VPLFRTFILRHLLRERLRSLITIVGIALGIGVVVAIQLTNVSSIRGFEAAVATMAGQTSLEIVGTGIGFDETRFGRLTWLRQYGELSPVIEGDVLAETGQERPARLRVLGVDMLRERPFRVYRLTNPEPRSDLPSNLLSLLLDPLSVVLTEKFARRHGIAVGSRIEITAGDVAQPFVVRGLLRDEGPARLLDGSLALMDIAAAQVLLGRLGYIDRVDLRLHPDVVPEEAEAAIAARLPPGLLVRQPQDRGIQAQQMLQAFHANLTALSYIALLVGLFLVFNTISVSVIARREEIGALRAIGVTRAQVLGLFLGEAGILAVAGCALGLALGQVMANGAVRLTSTAVEVLFVAAAAAPPRLDAWQVGLAFAVGVPLALAAAAVPAREASRVSPMEAIRGADRIETRYRLGWRHVVVPAGLFGAALVQAWQEPVGRLPLFGYGAALAVVFGAAFLVPLVLFGAGRLVRRWVARFFRVEAWLANASLAGAIPRLSISVAALAVSLSLTVAIAIMVSSFRETVIYWVDQTFRAGLYVAPEARGSANRQAALSPEVAARVTSHPAVRAVDELRRTEIPYDGLPVTVMSGDLRMFQSRARLLFKTGGPDALREAAERDLALVSESFALKHRKAPGDRVRIPTPTGDASLEIGAVYYDYSSDRGIILLDRSAYGRLFGAQQPSGLSVYLDPQADPDDVRAEILTSLEDRHRVQVRTNPALRTEILRIFDSTFAITYALEVVAIAVAILGVMGTLLTLILERRRELALLQLVGADRRQIRRMVMIEAALLGGVSQTVGLAVGIGLSLVLIYVINVQSFGWTIQFHLPAAFLLQSSGLVVLTTAVSGLYPARLASAIQPVHEVMEE